MLYKSLWSLPTTIIFILVTAFGKHRTPFCYIGPFLRVLVTEMLMRHCFCWYTFCSKVFLYLVGKVPSLTNDYASFLYSRLQILNLDPVNFIVNSNPFAHSSFLFSKRSSLWTIQHLYHDNILQLKSFWIFYPDCCEARNTNTLSLKNVCHETTRSSCLLLTFLPDVFHCLVPLFKKLVTYYDSQFWSAIIRWWLSLPHFKHFTS